VPFNAAASSPLTPHRLINGTRNGAALPVTKLVDTYYAEVEAMGGKRWDTSSLFARLEAQRKGKH